MSLLPKKTEGEEEALIGKEFSSFDVEVGIFSPVTMAEHQLMPMPSTAPLKDAQSMDPYRWDLKKMIAKDPGWMCNGKGFLCRKATVNVQVQAMVPLKCRTAALYNAQYPKWVGRPEGRRMYDS